MNFYFHVYISIGVQRLLSQVHKVTEESNPDEPAQAVQHCPHLPHHDALPGGQPRLHSLHDEPLFLIHHIDIVSVIGSNVLQSTKESLQIPPEYEMKVNPETR